MTGTRSGGCLCGAVRYEAQWPPRAVVACHCVNCQKQAGSAFSVIAVIPRDALSITGALKTFEDRGSSGAAVWRNFCPDCGSPVTTDTAAARADGIIFVKAGTLDDTSGLAPALHYWTASAQDWVDLPAGVTCLETQ